MNNKYPPKFNPIDLAINQPTQITILFRNVYAKEGEYGQYYLYTIEYNNIKHCWFVSEWQHEKIQSLTTQNGDQIMIMRTKTQDNKNYINIYSCNESPPKQELQKQEEKPVIQPSQSINQASQPINQDRKDALNRATWIVASRLKLDDLFDNQKVSTDILDLAQILYQECSHWENTGEILLKDNLPF